MNREELLFINSLSRNPHVNTEAVALNFSQTLQTEDNLGRSYRVRCRAASTQGGIPSVSASNHPSEQPSPKHLTTDDKF